VNHKGGLDFLGVNKHGFGSESKYVLNLVKLNVEMSKENVGVFAKLSKLVKISL
jgi:hypothetical protein